MIRQWDVFKADIKSGKRYEPLVTLQMKGLLGFNPAAYELLGRPDAVELMFDKLNGSIGIKAVQADSPHAVTVRRANSSDSRAVSAATFCVYYGIRYENSLRFRNIRLDHEGILVLDLRDAREVVKRTSRQRTESEDQAVPRAQNY